MLLCHVIMSCCVMLLRHVIMSRFYYVMLCHVTTSCYVMLCYLMSCYVMMCHVMSRYYVILCHVMSCWVILCHDVLSYVMLCHVGFDGVKRHRLLCRQLVKRYRCYYRDNVIEYRYFRPKGQRDRPFYRARRISQPPPPPPSDTSALCRANPYFRWSLTVDEWHHQGETDCLRR